MFLQYVRKEVRITSKVISQSALCNYFPRWTRQLKHNDLLITLISARGGTFLLYMLFAVIQSLI